MILARIVIESDMSKLFLLPDDLERTPDDKAPNRAPKGTREDITAI